MSDKKLSDAEWISNFYAEVAKGGTPQLLLKGVWVNDWGGQYGPKYPDMMNCNRDRYRIRPVPKAICQTAKLRGLHNAFRCGEWGDIIAVRMATPEGSYPRAVFIVQYDDDVIDSIPICDSSNYEIK